MLASFFQAILLQFFEAKFFFVEAVREWHALYRERKTERNFGEREERDKVKKEVGSSQSDFADFLMSLAVP